MPNGDKTGPVSHHPRGLAVPVTNIELPAPDQILALSTPSENLAFDVFIDSLDYLPTEAISKIRTAYEFSKVAHQDQSRISGEPYIVHPLAVAGEIAEWRLDADAIIAALLHDVMEDAKVSKEELAEKFGIEVAELVDGLSKLDKIEFQSYQEAQAENFFKMLLAMARDLRVILIKLSDRLHNLQTMAALRPDKRRRIAVETLEIYAPIANRLGLNKLFRELQDLSFENIFPLRANVISRALKAARANRQELLIKIRDSIEQKIGQANLAVQAISREKNIFNIYQEMVGRRLTFSKVLDTYTFNVIVADTPSCYLVLGLLHELYKPVPGKFKDYIAIPKANGYQSLHTSLIGPYGTPVEVQIRTEEMHQIAQVGVASYWLNKGHQDSRDELEAKTHQWLESLLEMKTAADNTRDFFENVKIDLFPDEVFIFTPKGRIINLPKGATVVDFAYAIHTDIGHRCIGARINHDPAPLRTELRSGDQVEILTATFPNPNPAWLNFIKTGNARSKIRHYLKTRQQEESATVGEFLLNQALNSLGVSATAIPSASWNDILRSSGVKSAKEIYIDIGLGKKHAMVVARQLLAHEHSPISANHSLARMTINGSEGMAIELSFCCHPIPGDVIVGSIKSGQGLVVHCHDCPMTVKSRRRDPKNWIDVDWASEINHYFDVRIRVLAKNQPGVLAKISAGIAENDANITDVELDDGKASLYTTLRFMIQVNSRQHLARIIRKLRFIPEVERIARDRD